MKITAAVMHEQGLPPPYAVSQPFRIEQVELEGPGEGEVLIEVRGAGLCHSDLAQVAGLRKRRLPVAGGHEGAGIVREIGPGVTGLAPGDHVVMTSATGCGRCPSCERAGPVHCDNVGLSRREGLLPNGQRRLSRGGEPLFHYSGVSTFAQFSTTAQSSLVKIDPSVPLDIAALFGCAVITGAGSVFNSARVRPGDSVAVIGLGGVGLNAVMAARIAGALEIIGIDIKEEKLALARELGCTRVLSAKRRTFVEEILDHSRGGVDFTFEMSGARSAVEAAFSITRKGGEIVCIGIAETEARYDYPHTKLVQDEKVIRGSHLGGGRAARDIPRYVDFYRRGLMPVDRIRSRTFGFHELNVALDLLDRGEVVRQVLLPHG